jgi:hypothetical protein
MFPLNTHLSEIHSKESEHNWRKKQNKKAGLFPVFIPVSGPLKPDFFSGMATMMRHGS